MGEVLVVGGGMAGVIAALSAKAAGAQVLVVRRALGATAMSSGAIDVATDVHAPADVTALGTDVMSAVREVARTRPFHPYAVLRDSLPQLEEALDFAARALEGLLAPRSRRNRVLLTPLGTVKAAALVQKTQDAGDVLGMEGTVALVQLGVNPLFDMRAVAQGLESAAQALGRTLRAVVVRSETLKEQDDALRQPIELAARFEAPGVMDALVLELRASLPPGTTRVLFPPVMGRQGARVLVEVSSALGVPCAELLSGPPSVPGLRLQEALDAKLSREGISLVDAEVRWESKALWAGERQLGAVPTVLATGKFIGGGIARDSMFRETLLGLPVHSGEQRLDEGQAQSFFVEPHEPQNVAFRAGVRTDARLRPLTAAGVPFRVDLHAAGAVVMGHDPATDKSGLGVAIFTGYLAGRWASGVA